MIGIRLNKIIWLYLDIIIHSLINASLENYRRFNRKKYILTQYHLTRMQESRQNITPEISRMQGRYVNEIYRKVWFGTGVLCVKMCIKLNVSVVVPEYALSEKNDLVSGMLPLSVFREKHKISNSRNQFCFSENRFPFEIINRRTHSREMIKPWEKMKTTAEHLR